MLGGVMGVVCWVVFQTDGFGKSYILKIDREEAIQKAEAYREILGLD